VALLCSDKRDTSVRQHTFDRGVWRCRQTLTADSTRMTAQERHQRGRGYDAQQLTAQERTDDGHCDGDVAGMRHAERRPGQLTSWCQLTAGCRKVSERPLLGREPHGRAKRPTGDAVGEGHTMALTRLPARDRKYLMPAPVPATPNEIERLMADFGVNIVDLLAMPDIADIEFEPAPVDAICQPAEFD